MPQDCPPLLNVVKHWCCSTDINERPESCENVLEILGKCDLKQSHDEVWEVKLQIKQ